MEGSRGSWQTTPLSGAVPPECVRAHLFERKVSGGHSGRVTPVPIPNTEVKPASADGTWGETPWESRSSPEFISDDAHLRSQVGVVACRPRLACRPGRVSGTNVSPCGKIARDVPGQRRARASRHGGRAGVHAAPRRSHGNATGAGSGDEPRAERVLDVSRAFRATKSCPRGQRRAEPRRSGPIVRPASSGGSRSRRAPTSATCTARHSPSSECWSRLAPEVAAIRELYGLTLYRLGRWREAVRELRAFHELTGSFDQHPGHRRLRAGAGARQGRRHRLGRAPPGGRRQGGARRGQARDGRHAGRPRRARRSHGAARARAASRCGIRTPVIFASGTRSATSTSEQAICPGRELFERVASFAPDLFDVGPAPGRAALNPQPARRSGAEAVPSRSWIVLAWSDSPTQASPPSSTP